MSRQVAAMAEDDAKWSKERGFGVYVHYPLCKRRCGYCDFATVSLPDFPHSAYADAVLRELEGRGRAFAQWPLQTIYLGGGSPSLWPAAELGRVVRSIEAFFGQKAREVTVEMNPQDATERLLSQLRRAGVSRLSLGLQALDDVTLKRLTRTHDAEQGLSSFAMARAAGFDNISCDLIFGAPGLSPVLHLEQIDRLARLGPEHISIYALTLEPHAPLYRAGLRAAEDDTMADLLEKGRERLEKNGYAQYEVSNYARKGRVSQHNLLVWRGRSYLGLGASAHSMRICDVPGRHANLRVANPAYSRYLATEGAAPDGRAVAGATIERVDEATARHELMMLGLRTSAGVERRGYLERFGRDPLEHFGEGLAKLAEQGLVHVDAKCIAPTRKGIFFADSLAVALVAG